MGKFTQNGRSMVEMLGVLAIIGVLSVGGLAGYSMAMKKYKINQQRDQIIRIMSGINAITNGDPTAHFGEGSQEKVVDILHDAKVISDSEYVNDLTIRNAYNGQDAGLYIQYHGVNGVANTDKHHMEFVFNNIDKDLCVDLLSNPPWKFFDYNINGVMGSYLDEAGPSNALAACGDNKNNIYITFQFN